MIPFPNHPTTPLSAPKLLRFANFTCCKSHACMLKMRNCAFPQDDTLFPLRPMIPRLHIKSPSRLLGCSAVCLTEPHHTPLDMEFSKVFVVLLLLAVTSAGLESSSPSGASSSSGRGDDGGRKKRELFFLSAFFSLAVHLSRKQKKMLLIDPMPISM